MFETCVAPPCNDICTLHESLERFCCRVFLAMIRHMHCKYYIQHGCHSHPNAAAEVLGLPHAIHDGL